MNYTEKQNKQAVDLIDRYHFEFLRERYTEENPNFADQFDESVTELKKFLKLILHSNGPMAAMSHAVDSLWHTFVLHTPQYVTFCKDVFGEYVHHQPKSKAIPVPTAAISHFYKEYPNYFGPVPAIWFEDIPVSYRKAVSQGEVPRTVQNLRWSGWPGWGNAVKKFMALYRV